MSYDPGISGISGANDVSLSNPADADALSYDNAVGKWRNAVVDKNRVGLGNVDNTADADKPVSNATQTALDGKVSASGVPEIGFANSQAEIPAGAQVGSLWVIP